MTELNLWLTKQMAAWRLSGFQLDLATSAILSALLMVLVILVGFLVEKLDRFLMDTASMATGKKVASFLLNRVMFIGTVFHELSHALFAVLTGAKVKKIRCFTLFSKEMLGYVEFAPTGNKAKQALQLSLISCAPVMTGFFTVPCFCILARYPLAPMAFRVFCGYTAISILCHMSMSKWDLQLYGRGAVITFPMLTMLIYVARFFLMPSAA